MSILGALGLAALAGLVGLGIKGSIEEAKEEAKRKSCVFTFPTTIPEETFEEIVMKSVKSIKKKIAVTISGPVVRGTVKSQSGLSEWDFSIDFNDYGSLTGNYWVKSDNSDSSVPGTIAETIKVKIRELN